METKLINRRVFGVGETVLDVVLKNDQPIAAVPGGSAFNAIISLGRAIGDNFPVTMITEVGDDHIGDIVVNFMKDNNVLTDALTRNVGTQTHISMAFLDENNDAQYEFYKDHEHASLDPDNINHIQFNADDILITGSYFSINPIIRDHTRAIFDKAHSANAIIYYDINFRKSHAAELPMLIDNIFENCQFADIVRGSTEDFNILFGTTDPYEIYNRYISQHCPIFICTDGAKPLTIITPSFTARYPVAKIETVSTIGAGDNFNAGVICALVENSITKQQLQTAGQDIWDLLIARGRQFSSQVCQSYFNYIEKPTN